ncbi:hypothetical protein ABZV31_18695 [Streptomyces sp. NPDC005202]|uniref:hypothetical protein n=1 Tax=Streptomyces sp. NPDC005202 TaxID=3157021 RepID=UPI0033A59D9A
MPNSTHNAHYRAGQLLAVLWTLHLLANGKGTPPRRAALLKKAQPWNFLREEDPHVTENLVTKLMTARKRGGEHWRRAVEVFEQIPEFLVPGEMPQHTMGQGEWTAFADGYADQFGKYKDEFGTLLP